MLCDECHQREARVFFTTVIGGRADQSHLCEDCAARLHDLDLSSLPGTAGFRDRVIAAIVAAHPRYTSEAYRFVIRSVEHSTRSKPPGQHVTASAVAEAFRELAWREFGPRALPTLAGWGLDSCDDIGIIVFRLVEAHLFGSRSGEQAADFSGLYDFATAFPTTA